MEAPHKVCNIGCSSPVKITSFLNIIERVAGKEAIVEMKEMQPGDVVTTYADITRLNNDYGYAPKVSIEEGIKNFYDWFVEYYEF